MTTFVYYIKDRRPYLTSLTYGGGDTVEIQIKNAAPTMIRIGDAIAKVENGVGRVKLSALSDGVYTPEVIFNDMSILLYPVRLALGRAALSGTEEICAALGALAFEEGVRVDMLEDEVKKLKEAIRGKDIF